MKDQSLLFRRKGGGGGGGKGGGGRSSKGGKSGKSGKSSSASRAQSTAKKYGASDSFVNSRGSKSFAISGTKSSSYAYAEGGGKRIVLGKDSAFSGREAGGGSRNTVYGTSHFGSGYPYGGYGYFISSRPLPYYYYPVPCSHNYYGGDEYLNVHDSQRPGGNLVTALVQPSYNTSSVTYRIVGDNSSVVAVFDALVSNCSVANSSSAFTRFEPSNKTWPLPEQVIQYYRASSFALSLDGYNNTAALPANAPASNQSQLFQMPDTPLPSGLNGTFLQCVNQTIGASVPLADPVKKGLSRMAIGGIVSGSIVGTFLLCILACCCHSKWKTRKQRKAQKSVETADDVPDIHVDSGDPPTYSAAYTKDLDEKDRPAKSRPASVDGRTLVADSSSRKERWSYDSSSASSRSDFEDTVIDHPSGKMDNQTRQGNSSEPEAKKTSWRSRIPFVGRSRNREGKHKSTSSVNLLLAEDSRHPGDLESNRDRRDSRSLSPSRSSYSSRSPSPSPSTAKFPLMSSEEKQSPG